MGALESANGYALRCAALKAREAKLLAKGIVPGSNKFYKLLYRRR